MRRRRGGRRAARAVGSSIYEQHARTIAAYALGYQSFPVYEFLPESASTARALSVRDSDPDAPLAPIMTEKEFSANTQDAQRRHCGGVG